MHPDLPSAEWIKSNRSGNGGNCVEVAHVGSDTCVRDTKNRAAGYFIASADQWQAFISGIKTNRFS